MPSALASRLRLPRLSHDLTQWIGRMPTWCWAVLVALVGFGVYWRAPWLGFTGDDALILYHLRRLGGLTNIGALFTSIDFFTHYRPVGFVSHALNSALLGGHPAGFHVVNLAVHVVNGVLVFVLGHRLLPTWAAALGAVLFVTHPSNHEAVLWVAARFDLLASMFLLSALLLASTRRSVHMAVAMVSLLLALLSKEAALAGPLVVGAHELFLRRADAARVAGAVGAMLAVVVLYSVLRSLVGGMSPVGGVSRLPKAAMLVTASAGLVALAASGWERSLARLARVRPVVPILGTLLLCTIVTALCLLPSAGVQAREKLSFVGFAAFYLLSPIVAPTWPPYFLDPSTPVYWMGGVLVVLVIVSLVTVHRQRLASDGGWLFLGCTVVGALIPVSSFTEGQRYLYLASVGVSIGIAKLLVDTSGRHRTACAGLIAALFALSVWQIHVKTGDWLWASQMTTRGISRVQAGLPACNQGWVVFLTAPVNVRGVYDHFYHQTFSQDGGCEPAAFSVVARMVRLDQPIRVEWVGPRTIAVVAPHYRGNFVLSANLRDFGVPQRSVRTAQLTTPLGIVVSRPEGEAQRITVDIDPAIDLEGLRFYYFGDGEIRSVPPPDLR